MRLFSLWHDHIEGIFAIDPVNVETRIECEDTANSTKLSKGDERSVCKIHWSVFVLLHQLANSEQLIILWRAQDQFSVLQVTPQTHLPLPSTKATKEMHRFRKTRPRGDERARKLIDDGDALFMGFSLPLISESDKGAGVNQNHGQGHGIINPCFLSFSAMISKNGVRTGGEEGSIG